MPTYTYRRELSRAERLEALGMGVGAGIGVALAVANVAGVLRQRTPLSAGGEPIARLR